MGWLWSSGTPADSSSTSAPAPDSIATPASSSIPSAPKPDASASHESEFNAAFPHLASPNAAPTPAGHPPSDKSTGSTPALDDEYPTTMSCRAAFDSAFYCSSFGGHFNHIYRYGELKSCSEHWADWRFCMGLKTRSQADKAALIQERYRKKDEALRTQPNSEDVWDRRTKAERHLGAFRPTEE